MRSRNLWAVFHGFLGVGIALLLLAGCAPSPATHDNALYGEYRLRAPLLLFGIRENLTSDRSADYFVVTEPPGIDGPEVVSSKTLPAGTVIRVVSIQAQGLGLPPVFEIRVINEPGLRNAKVVLRDVGPASIAQRDGQRLRLNPSLFLSDLPMPETLKPQPPPSP